jgi:hypothetical protein
VEVLSLGKDGSSFLFNSEFDVWQGFVNGNIKHTYYGRR